MIKELVMIHGRSFKPDEADLRANWYSALQHALVRDFGAAAGEKFDEVEKTFIYYGGVSNEFLWG